MLRCVHMLRINPRRDNMVASSNAANWAADGLSMMSRPAYLQFMSRGIAQLAAGIVRQMPKELEAQIDYNKILEAISIKDADTNECICADPWELGPGSKDKSTKFGHTREESVALWHEHKVSFARLIPSKKSAGACLYLF